MRKLPIYLLLDTSGSMHGEPIEAVKNGVEMLVSTLRNDPYALETAYLSVITFNTNAQQLVPLTELEQFQTPVIEARGCTALGEALTLLADRIDTEVAKTTAEQKVDWRPLVFIMTDGLPTDDLSQGLEAFRSRKTGMVVACAAGPKAQTAPLKKLTDYVFTLDTMDRATFKRFFQWETINVQQGGRTIGVSEETALPPAPGEINIVL